MLEKIIKIFSNKNTGKDKSLSDFFINSSSSEKKRIFKKAGQGANKDQRDLMEKHQGASKDMCEC